jgi:ligand-binding sensor domain-containing protein
MKNLRFLPLVAALLFLLTFLTSCSGQSSSLARENREVQAGAAAKTDAQIAEYVVEVFEDKNGNLWFGTMNYGAARYDGRTLTYLSTKHGLCDDVVVSIAEDQAGNLWFGTHNGASRYDGKTFTNFGRLEGLHGAGCTILVDRNGTVWAGTNHGAFRFNGTSFSKFDIPNPVIENPSYKWEAGKVWSLIEDRNGNIWFGRDGFGACRYDGASFTHFTRKDGLISNNVSRIVEDRQGNIWFGCLTSDFPQYIKEGGLCRYDGQAFTKFPEQEGLVENDIYTIYEDKAGNIWIGATRLGAYRYDGKRFTLFKETDRKDLTVNFGVQAMLEDKEGTLWFGFSGGLFRFDGRSFVNVTQRGPWK